MKRTPVISSSIATEGYDPATLTLEIEFKSGGVYAYQGVTPARYEAFRTAPSLGQHFHREIKGRYQYSKKVDEKVDTAK